MPEERLRPSDVSRLLGKTKKSVDQLIQNERFPNVSRERSPKGKTTAVWIPRSDVEAYAQQRGITLQDFSETMTQGISAPGRATAEPEWQQAAQRLAKENLELRARILELEQRLGVPPGA
jgi:hypothetical protein